MFPLVYSSQNLREDSKLPKYLQTLEYVHALHTVITTQSITKSETDNLGSRNSVNMFN